MRRSPVGILPVIEVDRRSATPLYRQLYDGYRQAILDRRLRAGQRLPSTRSLAVELGVSRIPVLNAFEQLLAEGYFESRVGSGTFVAQSLPDVAVRPHGRATPSRGLPAGVSRARVIGRRAGELARDTPGRWFGGPGAFNVGQPPVDRFPLKIWHRLVARHSRRFDPALLHYGPPLGMLRLREQVASYLRTARAVRCEADQIMVVSGSQQALDLTARTLLDERSPVWLEEPGYFGARKALTMAGARIVPVRVDEEGLDVEAGIRKSPRARAVFVTPSHQFPLGATMSAARRLLLLDWARRSGAWIIEDDYDSEYRFGNLPIPALQGLDRDARVIYFGTFTKLLFPSLRLGYIVLPRDLVGPFEAVRRSMDLFTPTLHQAVLADFIEEGHFERHIRRTRILCRERRTALVESLEEHFGSILEIRGDEAGMFLSAVLPDGVPDREIATRAAERGLRVYPLSRCYLTKPARTGFVLGYGGIRRDEIAAGVRQLRDAAEPFLPRLRGPVSRPRSSARA
ncbi:MAG TPA: PLP-dependent aminotransferase family protein [Thermoanaerobaculia bacterium]|nr:PLP-dependent aminotransferase family protein [Thermoanaerobaculia bacterium]